MGNDVIQFDARFSGRVRNIYVPVTAVLAIYAKENGRGMVFEEEDAEGEGEIHGDMPQPMQETPPKHRKPHLKVVK